jgi:hypothetical protein
MPPAPPASHPASALAHAPDAAGRAPVIDPRFTAGGYDPRDPRGYAEPALPPGYGPTAGYPQSGYPQSGYHQTGYPQAAYPHAQPYAEAPPAPGYPSEFGAPAAPPFAMPSAAPLDHHRDDEEYVEEEEPPRRSNRVMIAVALVGAIGLGGGLAYAWRTFVSPSSKTPLIKADATPTKTKAAPSSGGKVTERLGDQVASAADADVARTRQVPTQTITAPPPSAPPSPPASVSAMPGLVLDNSALVARPLPPVVPAAPPPPAASSGQGPSAVVPGRSTPSPASGAGPAPVNPRVAAAPPVPAAPPAPAVEKAAPPKVAAKTPVPKTVDDYSPSAAGGVAAAVGSTGSTGSTAPPASGLGASGNGFVAVIASQKSRLDAMKVFADMQQKYPDVLGSKAAEVQEVNLGKAKGGVWFRAVVGPPGSRQAAAKICSDLRAAGLPEKQCWATAY